MKKIGGFGKTERLMLIAAMLCFAAGLVMFALGREWTVAGVALMLAHGILLIRVMMLQADCIEKLIKDKEEYMQRQKKEHLNERVSYLKEELEQTRRVMEEQDRTRREAQQ